MKICSPRAVVLATAGLAMSSALSLAHDEDQRKLLDLLGPVEGPVWRFGDPVPRDGNFAASGVTCLAHLPLNSFAGTQSSGNDCWGYVSPSGREYAIMGLERGFGFVEITDPTNPDVIATIPGPASLWHDVKVIGEYAYGVSEGGAGIQVMDLRNIDNGTVTLRGNVSSGGHSTTHNIVANEAAGTLYLVGANIGNGGLVHLDLSNPQSPQVDGGWTDMYIHDAQVVTYTEGPFAGREIAFVASGFDGGFTQTGMRIVDVTDKSNMFLVSTLFYPNSAYSHQLWLSDDKQFVYLNDELDEQNGLASTTLTRIIDVSDINTPRFAGTYSTGRPAVDHNLYINGPVMYQANYRSGLRVIDAGDPLNPVEIGFFDTFPNSDSPSFNGAWSSYPYFPSGTVIVSDIERGLFVLRIDAQPQPRLRLTTPLGTLNRFVPEGGDGLTLDVREINLELDAATVVMQIDTGSGIISVPGTPAAGSDTRFVFSTPVLACDSSPRYWFEAESISGETFTLPADAPSSAFEADVVSSESVAFSDNFESNQGWSVSGNAADGQWTRGVPVGGGDRGDPASDFDGSGRAFLTDNVDDNSDVDDGSTTLTSPALDASAPGARLEYARWYNNSAGASPNEDVFVVEVSNNNGASWTNLETVGPAGLDTTGGWSLQSFRLDEVFTNPSSQFRVRFTASDLGNGSVVEAGVDAVRILSLECEDVASCPADFDGNGSVNILDVIGFITLWNSTGPGSDINNDGTVNILDVISFITTWNGGCP